MLVVGARGVGKSFWTAALSDEVLRLQIGETVQDLAHTVTHVGHAAKPDIETYPDRDTFNLLIGNGYEPYAIWRAVMLRWLANLAGEQIPADSWNVTVR